MVRGQYLWRVGLAASQPATLLGFPVMLAEDMPAIAANSLPIAFGDWKQAYTIVDRLGLQMLHDPFSAKPHTIFYAYRRVGGAVVDSNALKLQKISA